MIRKWKFGADELRRVLCGEKDVIIQPLLTRAYETDGLTPVIMENRAHFVRDGVIAFSEELPFAVGCEYHIAQTGRDLGLREYVGRGGYTNAAAVAIRHLRNRFRVVSARVSGFDGIGADEWERNGVIPRYMERRVGNGADLYAVYGIELLTGADAARGMGAKRESGSADATEYGSGSREAGATGRETETR